MSRASTDMGNVSQVLPVIHPYFGIGSWPAVNHQPEFAAATITATAEAAMLDTATALARTLIDAATQPTLRSPSRPEAAVPRDPRYDVLFEPVPIGPVTAPNRFYQVPHCNGMGYRDVTALATMRGIKAEGGWGVVCTEQVEFHYSSDITPFIELRLWDDQDIPATGPHCRPRSTSLGHSPESS